MRSIDLGRVFCLLGAAVFSLDAAASQAFEVRVATWNVHEAFTPDAVKTRSSQLQAFAKVVRPDVLVIEEVTSSAVAVAVRDAMGLAGYYVACSNFNPTDKPDFTALEVAVLSKYPFTQVIEYDPTPDNIPTQGDPDELPIAADLKLGLAAPDDVFGTRGFLWVRIADLKLSVVGVHLKSSRGIDGERDRANAVQREFVAAAIVDSIAQDRRLFPDYNCVVAGDFNVGHSDPKNGRDPARDDLTSSATTDGYDETHALFLGLGGLRMRNLMAAVSETTFPDFPSTPIDNIYVAGPAAEKFAPATMISETFGSDHRPVFSTLAVAGTAPPASPAPSRYQVPTVRPRPTAAASTRSTSPTAPAVPAGEKPTPIALAEVARHVGQYGSVEFEVRSGNMLDSGRMAFLNSKANFRDAGNFTVVINTAALQKFAAAGTTDPSTHFQGKRVRVTGVIAVRSGNHQLIVAEPGQIELLP